MNTQQQAYIEGFVKRANEYGLNQNEAIELLKSAANFPSNMVPNTPGSLAAPFATRVTGGRIPESLRYNPRAPGAGSLSGAGPVTTNSQLAPMGGGLGISYDSTGAVQPVMAGNGPLSFDQHMVQPDDSMYKLRSATEVVPFSWKEKQMIMNAPLGGRTNR